MTTIADLPLYLAVYQLQQYLYLLVRRFPKQYQYTLGNDILNLNWRTLDEIINANSLPNHKKHLAIRRAAVSFASLITRLRMAHEISLISHQKYAYLMTRNEEIEKMLSGWCRWSKKMIPTEHNTT